MLHFDYSPLVSVQSRARAWFDVMRMWFRMFEAGYLPQVVPRPQLKTAGKLPWYVFALYGGGAETKVRLSISP